MAKYLVSARRRNTGPSIEFQYPTQTGEDESLLAKRLLPNTAKENDHSIFHLGRSLGMEFTNRPKRRPTIVEPQDMEVKTIELYLYELITDEDENSNWEMIGDDLVVALLEPFSIQIIDDADQSELAIITPHFDLEFTEIEPCFACVLCDNGNILGARFQNIDDELEFLSKVEEMCESIAKSKEAKMEESEVARCIGVQLNCFSLIKNEVALCICTEIEYVYAFLPLLRVALDTYIEQSKESVLKEAFDAINGTAFPSPLPSLPFSLPISAFHTTTTLHFPRVAVPDQPSPTGIANLVKLFNIGIMRIYSCVMAEKRIVFYGSNCSVSQICECTITAALLAAPVSGIVHELVFPFTTIDNRFHRGLRYIAGVSEPEISKKPDLWDLLCNIDDGTTTWGPSVDDSFRNEPDLAKPFFDKLNEWTNLGYSEASLQRKFRQYTRRFVDAAVGRGYFNKPEDQAEWSQEIRRRALFWSSSRACERWEKSMESRNIKDFSIDTIIQRFYYSVTQLDDTEILAAFDRIKSATSTPERVKEVQQIIYDYDCLNSIGPYLLHSSDAVRSATKLFLYNMKYIQDDSELNPFFKFTYKRLNAHDAD